MLKHADEVTSEQICNNCDDCVPSTPTYGDDCQVFAQVIFRSAGRRENQACWEGKGNGSRGDQSSRTPLLEHCQKRGNSCLSEFTFQIGVSGLARKPESYIRANGRSNGGNNRVLVPRLETRRNENGDKDIGAAKGRDRRAIEDRESKEPERAPMTER